MKRPQRWEYRLQLSDVEREVSFETKILLGQHPSETTDHLVLRVLAYGLTHREGSAFGPGLCDGDAPDVLARDLTGRITLWCACGDISAERARHAVAHNRDAEVHAFFADPDRHAALLRKIADWPQAPRGWENFSLWQVDPELVEGLAGSGDLRQSWVVTHVGGRLYVEANGRLREGAVERVTAPRGP